MSERSPMRSSETTHSSSGVSHNDTLDDAAGAANNSIIGKVKSRVSSILPNSLSKWFSPSTKTNDSLNGSLLLNTTVSTNARRRRRIELDDDEVEDEEEDIEGAEENDAGEYDEESLRPQYHHPNAAQDDNSDEDDDGEEDENESNSEEDTSASAAATTTHQSGGVQPRRALNAKERVRQPPSKRSRINLDLSNVRGSPLVPRQPLVASTPALGSNSNMRGFSGSVSNPPSVLVPIRGQTQRYSHLNLYGGQQQVKKAPPYNFLISKREAHLDFTAHQVNDPNETTQGNNSLTTSGLSSRRSLNIPSSSSMQNTNELMYTGGLSHLKRQSLATVRNSELPSTSAGIAPLHRTSTTIQEVENDDEDIGEEIAVQLNADAETEATKHNGGSNVTVAKRQRLINGAESANVQTEAAGGDDSVSESSGEGVGCQNELNNVSGGRKTGLFNMSTANLRNGSRTSSVGNGLNFYSHLEGRKSLFAGGQGAAGAGGNASSVAALNNSTLSLTSLNRRQFNASIYGSTSALSDSRLLNTFSPFYKGKTTYGGAAAYNKYAAAATGASASSVRLTPTLIRPTSSLSTLSSSSNSLVATAGAVKGIAGGGENTSAISSTAKRILDLINDFATPLSEAKKMAGNLKTQQQQQLQSKSSTRLNEADLQATRALRLSQVRTPYMRPSVTLQPTTTAHLNGKSATLPPTRELQVPSMSQLLQMKKMQSTTERSRQITTQNTIFATATTTHAQRATAANSINEYILPNAAAAQPTSNRSGGDWKQSPQQQLPTPSQQKYTNKIKNKVRSSARITGSKDAAALAEANAPPPAVNLTNIAFPLMKSVPKIDIKLPSSVTSPLSSVKTDFKFTTGAPHSSGVVNSNTYAFNASKVLNNMSTATTKTLNAFNNGTSPKAGTGTVAINFKFSAPLELKRTLIGTTPTQQTTPISGSYKFSPPTLLLPQSAAPYVSSVAVSNTMPFKSEPLLKAVKVPQLKTGSVLEALKIPFKPVVAAVVTGATSFGDQFKKSTSEWECDACMLRNKQDANKCIACETPRKSAAAVVTNVVSSNSNLFTGASSVGGAVNSFGSQFKKSACEWECDACMLRNKQDAVKCVACETPHKGAAAPATTIAAPLLANKNTFGDAFKPKSNTWECDTCLVNNKADAIECIACQTRRPGAPAYMPAAATPSFKFGFGSAAGGTTKTAAADAVFQTLAAEQKTAKWECEACMTRNDAARVKCVCCEQAKPGTQTVSESVPKFAFGASAAAKFSFGFGAANAAKETELRQTATATTTATMSQKTDAAPAPTGFTFGVKTTTTTTDAVKSTSGGFTFGIKPPTVGATAPPDSSKAVAVDKKDPVGLAGFKFGSTSDVANSTAPISAGTATTVTAAAAASSATSNNTSASVKFILPTTIKPVATTTTTTVSASNEVVKSTPAAAATTTAAFSFGSPAAATTNKPVASGGFSFGSTASPLQNSKNDSTMPVAAESAAAGGFAFKTPAVTAAAVSTTTFATSAVTFGMTQTTAAAVSKPMFSFGASATTSAPAATTSGAATTVAGGFSFGSSSSNNVAPAATKTAPPAFNLTSSSSTATRTASANVFGAATSSSALPVFGAIAKASSTPAPAVASSTSTFGSFGSGGAAASNTNVFGSFGGVQSSPASKPTATATPFGNPSSIAPAAAAVATPFLFGGSSSITAATSTNANSAAAATTSTWPKNNFVFGGAATAATAAPNSTADSGTTAKTSNVFGSFGATQSTAGVTAPSLFGVSTAPVAAAPQSVFGSVASSTGTTGVLFGSNSGISAAASTNSTNLFGSTGPSGNATTPAPAFGTSPFGGGSSASATPTFGSAAAAPTTFGGFGSAASAAASNVTDGASAAKKSDPSVFSFGAAPAANAASQATSGGFNFGAPAAKPAFNFAPTNQPAFNFTGTVEQTQTMTTTMTTATPFQFGATPAAPIYNFSGGAVETTPNAPFQFNAGATPASNNIFAPQPTPGAPQSTQQQARRKIRAPIRRQTPR